jgi:hypothetical protein
MNILITQKLLDSRPSFLSPVPLRGLLDSILLLLLFLLLLLLLLLHEDRGDV